jgi:hypothetical protein
MVDHHHSGVERKGIMNRIGHEPAILSMTESYAVVHNVKHGVGPEDITRRQPSGRHSFFAVSRP